MTEGRESELSLQLTQQVLLGPWGGALLAICCAVIALAVPGWPPV